MSESVTPEPEKHGGINGQSPFRVLPRITDEDRPYWTGGEHGQLLLPHCRDCERWHSPPSSRCPYCLSTHLVFTALSGLGTVYSYTVNVQAWNPTFQHPYVIAVIELDEQDDLRLVSNIYGCAPEDVTIGMPVSVFFEQFEDVWLPLFRPAELVLTGPGAIADV